MTRSSRFFPALVLALGLLPASARAAGPPASIAPVSPTSVSLGEFDVLTLKVLVTDAQGLPVPSPAVVWSGPTSGPTAAFYDCCTDPPEIGQAQQLVAPTGGVGSYDVVASIAGVGSVTFHLTNLPWDLNTLRVISGGGASALVNTPFPEPIVVEARDVWGTLLPSISITASPSSTGASAVFLSRTVLTNADGRATFQATANSVAGLHNVRFSAIPAFHRALSTTTQLSNIGAPPQALVYVSGSGLTLPIGGAEGLLQARVLGPGNAPLGGMAVDFSLPASGAGVGAAYDRDFRQLEIVDGRVRTLSDASGDAVVYVFANDVPGSYDVTAQVAGVASTVTFSLTNTPRILGRITVNGRPEEDRYGSEAATGGAVQFYFTVYDTDGSPMSGVPLTLLPPSSGPSLVPDSTVIVTDENGDAYGSGLVNDQAGFYFVRAEAPGGARASVLVMNRPLGYVVGEPLADVSAPDHQGNTRSLSEFITGGRYLVLDLCAGWCTFCRQAQPGSLVAKAELQAMGIPVSIVPLLVESSELGSPSTAEDAAAWRNEYQLTDPVLHVGGDEQSAANFASWFFLGVRSPGFPTYFLIGPDGAILDKHVGIMTASQLKTFVLDKVPSQVSIGSVSVSEAAGAATLTVSRSFAGGPASVAFSTAAGTASGADFTATSGVVGFAAGQSTKTISIPLKDDDLDEPGEKFTVNLSNPQGLVIAQGQGVVTIADDDAPSALSVDDLRVAEGTGGTTAAKITLRLDRPSAFTVAATFETVGGTAKSTDFTAVSGKVSFKPGETTQTVAVTIVGDKVAEAKETFTLRLTAAENASIAGGEGLISIVDDDADTVAPVISAKGDIVVEVKMAAGASVVVTYAPPTAKDDRDGAVNVDCVAPSGAKHGYGKETVTCTAEDRAGNLATRTFTLTVQPPTVAGALFDPRERTTPLTEAERGDRVLVLVNPGAFAARAKVDLVFIDARGRRHALGEGRADRDGGLSEVFELPHGAARGVGQVFAQSGVGSREYDRAWFLSVTRHEPRGRGRHQGR